VLPRRRAPVLFSGKKWLAVLKRAHVEKLHQAARSMASEASSSCLCPVITKVKYNRDGNAPSMWENTTRPNAIPQDDGKAIIGFMMMHEAENCFVYQSFKHLVITSN